VCVLKDAFRAERALSGREKIGGDGGADGMLRPCIGACDASCPPVSYHSYGDRRMKVASLRRG